MSLAARLRALKARLAGAVRPATVVEPLAEADVVFAYRFFLGREPESDAALAANRCQDRLALVVQLAGSAEYSERVVAPLLQGGPPAGGLFDAPPPAPTLAWAAAFPPLEPQGRASVAGAADWSAAHRALLADPTLLAAAPQLRERLPLETLAARGAVLAEARAARALSGAVEGASAQAVRGYAFDGSAPETPVPVELWIDGALAAAGVADAYRRDLEERFGGSGRHGFSFEGFSLPSDRGDVRVEVREVGSGLVLGARRLAWRTAEDVGDLARLFDDRLQARTASEAVERELQDACAAFGFTPQSFDAYWRAFYARTPARARREAAQAQAFAWRPRFDVLLVGDDPDARDATRASLRAQVHPEHRIVVVPEDGSGFDPVALAGDYAVVIDAGDTLAPDALHRIAAAAQGPRPGFVTMDSDTVDAEGRHREPLLRPAFDYDLLLQAPGLGPAAAVRADALREALSSGGRLATAARGDLWLRVVEAVGADAVRHLPRVLHHAAPRPPPDRSALEAVRAHFARIGSAAQAQAETGSSHLRIVWPSPQGTRAAVIVPTRDRMDLLGPCLDSLEASRSANAAAMRIVVVDNGSVEPATHARLRALEQSGGLVLRDDGPFNWSRLNNLAAAAVEAEVLVFLNNDTVVLAPDWCDALCAQALRPQVGAVGARLLYGDDSIQHAGIVLGTAQAIAVHEGAGEPRTDEGYLGRRGLAHRTAAVTGACLVTRRDLFLRLGGFDAVRLPVEANDIDYALRVAAEGLAVIYEPRCVLRHFESRSRGRTDLDEDRQRRADAQLAALERRWGEALRRDPWFNPHFDRSSRPFTRLGPPPEL